MTKQDTRRSFRRGLSLLLALLMLASCLGVGAFAEGETAEPATATDAIGVTEHMDEDPAEEPVEEPIEEPAEEPEEEPTEEPTEEPVEETTEEPTEEPAEEPAEEPVESEEEAEGEPAEEAELTRGNTNITDINEMGLWTPQVGDIIGPFDDDYYHTNVLSPNFRLAALRYTDNSNNLGQESVDIGDLWRLNQSGSITILELDGPDYQDGASYSPSYYGQSTNRWIVLNIDGDNITLGGYATHTHQDAGGNTIEFQPWTDATGLPSAGNYFLATDVTVTAPTSLTGTLNLCLHGHGITGNGDNVFKIDRNQTLNLFDCEPNAAHNPAVTVTDPIGGGDVAIIGGYIKNGRILVEDSEGAGGAVFNMYGGTICGLSNQNFVVNVAYGDGSGNVFNMYGGTIAYNDFSTANGDTVFAGSKSTFTMSGSSSIHHNKTARYIVNSIGAITMSGSSSIHHNSCVRDTVHTCGITMSGGSIHDNVAGQRGGVFCEEGNNVMSGGSITRNRGGEVGGVFCGSQCTFTMSGGSITDNLGEIGGVSCNGIFNMTGGSVTGNKGTAIGGVFVYGYCNAFKLSGNPEIWDNKQGATLETASKDSNVFLGSDMYNNTKPITITGALNNDVPIGITMASHIGVFTTGASFATDEAAQAAFFSDSPLYGVRRTEDSNAQLIALPVASVTEGDKNPVLYTKLEGDGGALEAWVEGSKLTLLADVEITDTIYPPNNSILDLNGHGILQTTAERRVMRLNSGVTFTMIDSDPTAAHTITREIKSYTSRNDARYCVVGMQAGSTAEDTDLVKNVTGGFIGGGYGEYGGIESVTGIGVYVSSGAVFNMRGGSIVGNTCKDDGGGLYVSGTFNMYAPAVIAHNSSDPQGGGVYIQGGTFNMYGGSINNNASFSSGGGVEVFSQSTGTISTFNMYGGTISNNTANDHGGGICSYSYVYIYGGTITGNVSGVNPYENRNPNGGGIYSHNVAYPSVIGLSGKVNITGNMRKEAQNRNDVYIGGAIITVGEGGINPESEVGVIMDSGTGVFTQGGTFANQAEAQAVFFSDVDGYVVRSTDSGEAQLCYPGPIYSAGEGGVGEDTFVYATGRPVKLLTAEDVGISHPTKAFLKWIDEDHEAREAGTNVYLMKDTVMTATWTDGVKVTFDANGGSEVAYKIVISGQPVRQPEDPVREGYALVYWTLDGEPYDFSTPVTRDITLVALWAQGGSTIDKCDDLEGWTRESTNNDFQWVVGVGDAWTNPAVSYHSADTNFMIAPTGTGDDKAYLIMPKMDLSAMGSATLSFWYMARGYYYSGVNLELAVCYRVNGGEWQTVWTIGPYSFPSDADWKAKTVDLPAEAMKNNVEIAFRASGSDNSDRAYFRGLGVDDVELLVKAAHTHDFTYTAAGDTITAVCKGVAEGTCVLPPETLTIASPTDLQYNGEPKPAALDYETGSPAFPQAETKIVYTKNGQTVSTPTDIGPYTASITYGEAKASVNYTIQGANFIGGGLRRRVFVGTTEVVNFETDLRLVFGYGLPEGAELVIDTSEDDYSYFLWSTGENELDRKVPMSSYDKKNGICSLVLVRVPEDYFDLAINGQLHLVYKLNGTSYAIDTEPNSRTVKGVCEKTIEEYANDPRNATWVAYAKYLLGQVKDYVIT